MSRLHNVLHCLLAPLLSSVRALSTVRAGRTAACLLPPAAACLLNELPTAAHSLLQS